MNELTLNDFFIGNYFLLKSKYKDFIICSENNTIKMDIIFSVKMNKWLYFQYITNADMKLAVFLENPMDM